MPNLWQIAAGDYGRRYHDLFIKHDVMFLGPGYTGNFADNETAYQEAYESNHIRKSELDRVKRFYHQVNKGDFVVARAGHEAVALGVVADDQTEWDERFDDVYGWEVQHRRRVCWQDFSSELNRIQASSKLFSNQIQVKTFTKWDQSRIEHLFDRSVERELKPLPSLPSNVLDPAELSGLLYERGIAFDLAEKFGTTLVKINQLIKFYQSKQNEGGRPSEHEVVPYLIIPLLQGLGWSQQLIGVEWQKIDAAIFRRTPTKHANCCLVVEAKGMWDGLQNAREQAIRIRRQMQSDKLSKSTSD